MDQASPAPQPSETVGVEAARRRLPELLDRAAAGQSTWISRHGKPIARLGPLEEPPQAPEASREAAAQHLLSLQGSGGGSKRRPFSPSQLQQGAVLALDGTALVAYLQQAEGTGQLLGPLLQGIAQGYWRGVISSLSLARVLEGPLADGQETLVQRYSRLFRDPRLWSVRAVDAAIVEAAMRLRQNQPALDHTSAIELATAIEAQALVLITDHPALAQSQQLPVWSALRT